MLIIIGMMLVGGVLGLFAGARPRLKRIFKIAGRVQQIGTTVLLFAMGIWLGGNEEFWGNIQTLGLQGVLFALCTVLGSALCVFFLTRRGFPRGDKA